MIRIFTILITLFICVCNTHAVLAQDKGNDKKEEGEETIPLDHFYADKVGPPFIRKILSKLTFGLSTGYGSTTFKHDLTGYSLYQAANARPIIFDPADPTLGYTNWFNEVKTAPLVLGGDPQFSSEDTELGFKSKSFNIPLRATVHYEFLKRYRVGLGYSFEFTKVGEFEPLSNGNVIRSYESDVSSFFLKKYFIILGASVYRYQDYLLTVDANIGGYGLGKKFDKDNMKRGVFINIGATVERDLSEYFKVFVRPSYEIKGFDLSVEPSGKDITHKMNAFYVNIGASYRLPELRKCFIKQCRAQRSHAHQNREYRSRMHPIYKKQNPHYGENYPELIKYKGKNKRKLNPY